MHILFAIAVIWLLLHLLGGHAKGRRRGHRGIMLFWSSVTGPRISIPGPFKTRISRKI